MADKPLLCRLNLFHKWRTVIGEDGNRSLRCAKCGKDDDASGGPSRAAGSALAG